VQRYVAHVAGLLVGARLDRFLRWTPGWPARERLLAGRTFRALSLDGVARKRHLADVTLALLCGAACADILNFLFAGAAPSILLRNWEVRAILPG
jgi:hypothetical protein